MLRAKQHIARYEGDNTAHGWHGRARIDTETREMDINNYNNIYLQQHVAQNNTLRATREMGKRQWRQYCAQINTPWALKGNGLDS